MTPSSGTGTGRPYHSCMICAKLACGQPSGQVDIGFMACRESVPDLWRLAGEIPEALAELVKLARDKAPATD